MGNLNIPFQKGSWYHVRKIGLRLNTGMTAEKHQKEDNILLPGFCPAQPETEAEGATLGECKVGRPVKASNSLLQRRTKYLVVSKPLVSSVHCWRWTWRRSPCYRWVRLGMKTGVRFPGLLLDVEWWRCSKAECSAFRDVKESDNFRWIPSYSIIRCALQVLQVPTCTRCSGWPGSPAVEPGFQSRSLKTLCSLCVEYLGHL